MILIAQVSSDVSDQSVEMLESLHCSHTQSMAVNSSVEKPCPTCLTWSLVHLGQARILCFLGLGLE